MIPTGFKPNLAATLTKPELIKFPVWASPKIDGIRCVVFGGVAYSRSLKPIPNPLVQEFASAFASLLEGLDGELTVGSPTDANCMQNSMAVMAKKGEPDFTYHVFDYVSDRPYWERSQVVEYQVTQFYVRYPEVDIRMVPQHLCETQADVDRLEAQYLDDGYEGLMVRASNGLYKYGRSTEREGGLVKVKRFVDAEAEVIGFEEEMHNTNEAKRDALGNTERSTAKDGLVGKGTLGALVVACDNTSTVFNIGTGFTAAQRRDFWNHREELLGQLVTYKYFDHGIKEAPRHPVFKSFRHADDQ